MEHERYRFYSKSTIEDLSSYLVSFISRMGNVETRLRIVFLDQWKKKNDEEDILIYHFNNILIPIWFPFYFFKDHQDSIFLSFFLFFFSFFLLFQQIDHQVLNWFYFKYKIRIILPRWNKFYSPFVSFVNDTPCHVNDLLRRFILVQLVFASNHSRLSNFHDAVSSGQDVSFVQDGSTARMAVLS